MASSCSAHSRIMFGRHCNDAEIFNPNLPIRPMSLLHQKAADATPNFVQPNNRQCRRRPTCLNAPIGLTHHNSAMGLGNICSQEKRCNAHKSFHGSFHDTSHFPWSGIFQPIFHHYLIVKLYPMRAIVDDPVTSIRFPQDALSSNAKRLVRISSFGFRLRNRSHSTCQLFLLKLFQEDLLSFTLVPPELVSHFL